MLFRSLSDALFSQNQEDAKKLVKKIGKLKNAISELERKRDALTASHLDALFQLKPLLELGYELTENALLPQKGEWYAYPQIEDKLNALAQDDNLTLTSHENGLRAELKTILHFDFLNSEESTKENNTSLLRLSLLKASLEKEQQP